ncbi:hypothetical protein PanWU01x14_222620 [Parasponia andersonii]|uniref:Uncharacterized protein n=1 Tax=Parasponia andersonii TaxID=3476 RepID=A0A2P5BP13_PARAD|nr:hypothetical protein PanWU01x14_222620 [Parasponia andersonii]
MGDDKTTSSSIVMASRDRDRDRDRELLIPVADSPHVEPSSKPSSSSSSTHHPGREVSDRGFGLICCIDVFNFEQFA